MEAREARIAATYEQALLCIQQGEQREAVVRHWSWSQPGAPMRTHIDVMT